VSVHDRWNGARTGEGRRYEVRWRSGGKQHKQRFTGLKAAQLFDAKHKADPGTVDRRASLTVAEMCEAWLGTVSVRDSTMRAYRLEVAHINAAFGERLASQVKPSEVRTWLARNEPGISIRRRCLVTLRRAYGLALADRVLSIDPTQGAKPPRQVTGVPQFLSWAALAHLAECAGPDAPLIWLLGTGGLRLSEAVALDQEDIDRVRNRVRIRAAKTTAGVREVPVDPEVLALLPTHPGAVFRSPKGGTRLSAHNWRVRRFGVIAEQAGLSPLFTPHKLRHTAASLAIAAGADALTVANMLGHTNPSITLRTYSHLYDTKLDDITRRMSAARTLTLQGTSGALDASEGAKRSR
jgi:integrase